MNYRLDRHTYSYIYTHIKIYILVRECVSPVQLNTETHTYDETRYTCMFNKMEHININGVQHKIIIFIVEDKNI